MNPTCAPEGGEIQEPEIIVEPVVIVEPEPEVEEPEVVIPEEVTPEPVEEKENSSGLVIAIVVIVFGLLVLLGLIFVWLYLRKRRFEKKLNQLGNDE